MNNESFYESLDFKYPELGTVIENGSGNVKMYIPALMPFVENAGDDPKTIKNKINSKSNILSKSPLSISDTTSSNYINVKINGSAYKGDQYVIVFIGGDPNKPVAIGRY